jgi:CRP-like cAMP-binding protein
MSDTDARVETTLTRETCPDHLQDAHEVLLQGNPDLATAMRESAPHREALADEVKQLIASTRHKAISLLEQATAGQPDLFRVLRKQALDEFGRADRELAQVLGNYAVRQVYERKVVKVAAPTTSDKWRLPAGVKMPSSRQGV